MGLGAFPAAHRRVARHARHARHLRSQYGDEPGGPDPLPRRALRRSRDRSARRVLARTRRKIHVDIDRSSINKNVRVDLPIVADVGSAHRRHGGALEAARPRRRPISASGGARIDGWRARKSLAFPQSDTEIMPQRAIQRLWELTHDRDPIITTEVGQHQMWAAQHFHFEAPNRWLTSGGLGTMGYGLPAAIGAQLGNPDRAGHRHRRRGLDPDEHPGDVDGHTISLAGQGLHPQQRLYGDGPPVAGTDLRRAAIRKAIPRRCPTS